MSSRLIITVIDVGHLMRVIGHLSTSTKRPCDSNKRTRIIISILDMAVSNKVKL